MALENSPVAMFEQDLDLRYTWIYNPRLGYSVNEVIGKSDFDIMDPASGARLSALKRGVIETGQAIREVVSTAAPGAPLEYFDLHVEPRRNEAGNVIGVICSATDITERKWAEEEIRATEQRLRLANEATGVGIWELDLHTNMILWDKEMFRIYGMDPTEDGFAPYSDWSNAVHPDDLHRQDEMMRDTVSRPGGNAREFRIFRRNDGDLRYIEAREAIRTNAKGEAQWIVGTNLDCTDRRKEAQELLEAKSAVTKALQASQSLFKKVMDATPDGVWVFDQNKRCLDVNDAYCQISGYSREELLSMSVSDVEDHLNPEVIEDAFANVVQTGNARFETVHRTKAGKRWPVEASMVRVAGDVPLYVGIARDMTKTRAAMAEIEKHRLHLERLVEERTRQLTEAKQAAEAANVAKSVFLANMSHEIRTPLNGILGVAHIMRRCEVTPKQLEQLNTIEASGQHLMNVINDVLDLSKIEAGKLTLEQNDFEIADMLNSVQAVVIDVTHAKGLKLVVDASNLPKAIVSDATRLSQVLVNYLSNAIKFTAQGCVTLTGRVLEETEDEYLLRFEVSDTGIGMSPDEVGRVFSAFVQGDASTTRKYGGTGLGLTINRRIVQLLDGEVGVQSNPGQGSTFWLTARVGKGVGLTNTGDQTQESPEETLRRDYCGRRVLLVEDDAVNQMIAEMLLTDVGLTIESAGDGVQAVRLASEGNFDLILMDLQMPLMDGLEATRAIRRLPGRNAVVPIVALTGNAFIDDRLNCLDAGMNDFLTKPYDPNVLFGAVLKWLSKLQPMVPIKPTE